MYNKTKGYNGHKQRGGLKISGVENKSFVGHSLNFYKFVAFLGRKCFHGIKK